MKLSLKAAIAAALTMASLGAFAQQVTSPTPPFTTLNTQGNGGSATLTLFSSDDGTPFSYSFNLGLNLADLLPANGVNTPGTTLTWSLTGLSTDLSGFTATSSLLFDVSAATQSGSIVTKAGAVNFLTTVDPSVNAAALLTQTNSQTLAATSQLGRFLIAGLGSTGTPNATTTQFTGITNPYFTTNTTDPGYANANLGQGYNQFSVNTAGAVGTALPFYDLVTGKGSAASNTLASATELAGTWNLNLSNDTLTYSVPGGGGTAPVPLPPSAWLLMSGLAGAAILGRRRKGLVNDMGTLAV